MAKLPKSETPFWDNFRGQDSLKNENVKFSIGETKSFSVGVFASFSKFVALVDLTARGTKAVNSGHLAGKQQK